MEAKSTVFAGFLDGYKARNIAASASSVTYQFDEIKNSVHEIMHSQRDKKASSEIIQYLERLENILSDNGSDFLSMAISCGEYLKTILIIAKQNGDPSSLLSEDKMKRIIYRYLEFAELSEDKAVGDLAIAIAESF